MTAQRRVGLQVSSRLAPCHLPVAHALRSVVQNDLSAYTSRPAHYVLERVLGCYYSTGWLRFPNPLSFCLIASLVTNAIARAKRHHGLYKYTHGSVGMDLSRAKNFLIFDFFGDTARRAPIENLDPISVLKR